MTTVYAVSHGSYSDYGIVAMFSDRETAQEAIDSMGGDAYGDERIEEWTVFDVVPRAYMVYVKEFYAGKVSERSVRYPGWETTDGHYVGRVTRGLGFGKWDGHYRYWGKDKARVHKAFDDYHAQRQAEQAGVA